MSENNNNNEIENLQKNENFEIFQDDDQVFVSTHPLIRHKLDQLRKVSTSPTLFRSISNEITMLLAYEACADLPLKNTVVETPLEKFSGVSLQHKIAFVPILRAGLGMVEGALNIIPNAVVWHIGLYRNEKTLKPVTYYNKLNETLVSEIGIVCVIDPMLATGGSIIATIDALKEKGAQNIKVLAILGAPEGVNNIKAAHPEVTIYLAGLDRGLNEHGYILPGLGDAGDRQFGTIPPQEE